MGMYVALRFKGVIKEDLRIDFENIALFGAWSESNISIFNSYANLESAYSIPMGKLQVKDNVWEDANSNPLYGFDRTYDSKTGEWHFQCSLKDVAVANAFTELLPLLLESLEYLEVYYEMPECTTFYYLDNNSVYSIDLDETLLASITSFIDFEDSTSVEYPWTLSANILKSKYLYFIAYNCYGLDDSEIIYDAINIICLK